MCGQMLQHMFIPGPFNAGGTHPPPPFAPQALHDSTTEDVCGPWAHMAMNAMRRGSSIFTSSAKVTASALLALLPHSLLAGSHSLKLEEATDHVGIGTQGWRSRIAKICTAFPGLLHICGDGVGGRGVLGVRGGCKKGPRVTIEHVACGLRFVLLSDMIWFGELTPSCRWVWRMLPFTYNGSARISVQDSRMHKVHTSWNVLSSMEDCFYQPFSGFLVYFQGGRNAVAKGFGTQQQRPPCYLLTNSGCSRPHPLAGEGHRKRRRKKDSPVLPLRPKSPVPHRVPKPVRPCARTNPWFHKTFWLHNTVQEPPAGSAAFLFLNKRKRRAQGRC